MAATTFIRKASGDIVLVTIDDQSLQDISRWPWPRRYHADLTDALTNAGAKRIFFDLLFHGPTTPVDDRICRGDPQVGKVYLAVRTRSGTDGSSSIDANPMPLLTKHARLGNISVTL